MSSGGAGGGGGGAGGGGGGGGNNVLPPKSVGLKKENIGFGEKNTVSYVDLRDKRYDNPEVKATIVLFFSAKKNKSAATTQDVKAPQNVLQKAFDKILTEKDKYNGIYFASINVEKEIERKGDDSASKTLKGGMIRMANDPNSLFNWFYNRPRDDPNNKEVVKIEKEIEDKKGKEDYTFNIVLPGDPNPRSKFPLILVYRGRYPQAFYEGPYGTASPKDTKNFDKQFDIVKSILTDFIQKQAIDISFRFDNKDFINTVRKEQWEKYNSQIIEEERVKLDLFNYIEASRKGYLKTGIGVPTIPVIPATPSFVFQDTHESENMLGQKDNEKSPEDNNLIIVIPKLLPIPKREFPEPRNDEEKRKIQEQKTRFEEEKQKIIKKNEVLQMESIYMPALPAFYFNDKGQMINLDTKK